MQEFWETWSVTIIIFAAAVVLGLIAGRIIGKMQVNRMHGRKKLFSPLELTVLCAVLVVGVCGVLAGVLMPLFDKGDGGDVGNGAMSGADGMGVAGDKGEPAINGDGVAIDSGDVMVMSDGALVKEETTEGAEAGSGETDIETEEGGGDGTVDTEEPAANADTDSPPPVVMVRPVR